jgi:hypothetical protein
MFELKMTFQCEPEMSFPQVRFEYGGRVGNPSEYRQMRANNKERFPTSVNDILCDLTYELLSISPGTQYK